MEDESKQGKPTASSTSNLPTQALNGNGAANNCVPLGSAGNGNLTTGHWAYPHVQQLSFGQHWMVPFLAPQSMRGTNPQPPMLPQQMLGYPTQTRIARNQDHNVLSNIALRNHLIYQQLSSQVHLLNAQNTSQELMKREKKQAEGSHTRVLTLALSTDEDQLSEYQILIRQNLELFEARQEDVETSTQGRKRPVFLGQIGLRCKHCAHISRRQRGRGSVYFPARLNGIYQAAQNMTVSHLLESCDQIPESVKMALHRVRAKRNTASGGKQYWIDSCYALGLQESEEGLRLYSDSDNKPGEIKKADKQTNGKY